MAVGTFALVLHSHLPYYRKAGMWPFGEENLYEAIAETYLPLLDALNELLAEGIPAKISLGLTPILLEQLADPHCLKGFEAYVAAILERLERDVHRYSPEGELEQAQWDRGEALSRLREELDLEQSARRAERAVADEDADALRDRDASDPVARAQAMAADARGMALELEGFQAEVALELAQAAAQLATSWGLALGLQDTLEAMLLGAQASLAAGPEAQKAKAAHPVDAPLGVVGAVVAPLLGGQPLASDVGLDATAASEEDAAAADLAEWLEGLDPELRERYLALAEEPLAERPEDPRKQLVQYYMAWYQARLDSFHQKYQRNIVGAFKALQDAGAIEIIASSATHGFSPLLGRDSALKAQFATGTATYRRHFGKDPVGIWLPECAYRPALDTPEGPRPGVERFLFEEGLRYFFTDAHAVTGGQTVGYRRQIGLYGAIEYVPMPERPLTGLTTFSGYWLPELPVAYFARNDQAGYQVWSAERGYPGEPAYREFHKRDGHSGMKYWKVTGPQMDLAEKTFYDPSVALDRVHAHADHYVKLLEGMLEAHANANGGEAGLVVVPFDTELFGHWWFEGVAWIKEVVRRMAASHVACRTVGEIMATSPPELAYQLPESTWGEGGHYHVWLNPKVEFMWPIVHRCERQMELLVDRFADSPDPLVKRALTQAGRELLLLEGSDWPFLVTTGQAKRYAIERFRAHVDRFEALADGLLAGAVDEAVLAEAEDHDNPFPDLDVTLWRERQGEGITLEAEAT